MPWHRQRQVVLAFDTAERLMYEPDEVQVPLGIDMEETGVEVLPWFLRSFLSQLENIVVLLAARPNRRRLHGYGRIFLPA